MSITDEIKLLTTDPGTRRLAEVVEALQTQVDRCCPCDDHVRPASPCSGELAPSPPSDAHND